MAGPHTGAGRGEMVITRYTLCDLLGKLDQLLPPAGEEEP